jgi:hypothetical protein
VLDYAGQLMKYDTTLKALFRQSPPVALQQVAGEAITRWNPVELPEVQNLRTDLLGEARDGMLVQIEIQSDNDSGMPFRMLRYSVAITDLYKRVPQQVVLYVGSGPLKMPSAYEWEFGIARYKLIDIRDLDGDALLASPSPSDNVLGILARLTERSRSVKILVEKLAKLAPHESASYARALLILAGLRPGLAAELEKAMTYQFDPAILENEVLGPIYREGERAVLRRLMARRFGPIPDWAETRLATLSSEEVDDISARILDAQSLEQLFQK